MQIPKLFNAKNRLFFMSNFEGFKSRRTTTSFATTLTAAMREGDFSAIPTPQQDPNHPHWDIPQHHQHRLHRESDSEGPLRQKLSPAN